MNDDNARPEAENARPAPKLTLAKSLTAKNYPASFTFEFHSATYYITPNADKLYSHQKSSYPDGSPSYREHKKLVFYAETPQRKALFQQEVREKFSAANIDDYCMIVMEDKVDFRFTTDDDAMKAFGIVAPEQPVTLEFLTYPADAPAKELAETAKNIQESYNNLDREKAGLTAPVSLSVDFGRRTIYASTIARDVSTVMKQADQFEAVIFNH